MQKRLKEESKKSCFFCKNNGECHINLRFPKHLVRKRKKGLIFNGIKMRFDNISAVSEFREWTSDRIKPHGKSLLKKAKKKMCMLCVFMWTSTYIFYLGRYFYQKWPLLRIDCCSDFRSCSFSLWSSTRSASYFCLASNIDNRSSF